MAETNIKSEPRSRAATESEPVADDLKQDPPASQFNVNRGWSVTPEPPDTDTELVWRDCAHLNYLQQIEVKEAAVRDAGVCLPDIRRTLRNHSSQVTSTQKWLDRIQNIYNNKKKCRVLIGFLGASGAGKSSLINALLEQDDLLPADDEKACTAVCVEIAYNHSEDSTQEFTAKVDRISEDNWRVELETLFKDLEDQAQNNDGEDGEPDLERDMRIKAAFQKLKCVYPHIKTPKDLKTYKVQNLLDHPNVKDILGKSKVISDSTRDGFAAKIKPFIDSSNSKEEGGKSFAHWPLVKLVRILVKSRILKDGIVLVDLPGSMDTNIARGAIAENYQKHLKVTCIVAPTQRAASDKPAQDLLGRVTQRTLQLDNHFSSESLCFIVSKTDSSLNISRYIKTHPNVEGALSYQVELEKTYNLKLDKVNCLCAEHKQTQVSSRLLYSELSKEYTKIQPEGDKKLSVGRPKKRKRDDADDTTDEPLTEEEKKVQRKASSLLRRMRQAKGKLDSSGGELYKGQEKIRELEDAIKSLQSLQKAACIKNRNEVSTEELRKDYQNVLKQMGQKNKKPLQVFCVSALAFAQMAKESKQVEGFPRLSDTGIPSLQRWLVETTLKDRERHAVSFLEDVVSLELSIAPWVADTSAEFKMPPSQREAVEKIFDDKFETLQKDFFDTNARIIKVCDKLVESGVFSKMSKNEISAARETERIVKSWAQKPIYWSTHRALNRNRGEWKTYKGVSYNWNEELAGNYLEPLITRWSRIIHNRLPDVRSTYDSDISKLVENFAKSVAGLISDVCPEMSEAVEQWKERILRIPAQIQKHSFTIFNDKIQDAAREAHRTVKPKIEDCWGPIYDQCAAETGTGHFKRNQVTHIDHAKKIARRMYQRGSKAIQAAFLKLWAKLPANFGEGTIPASIQIRDEFETMISNHTLREETNEINQCAAKLQLQQDIQASFDKLKAAWATKIVLPTETEEPDLKPEDIDIDDLFNPEIDMVSLGSDSEYEDELGAS